MLILAISGSLRRASSNTAVLGAARRLAPAGVHVELYDGLETLPYFNPELDEGDPPPPVRAWRDRVLGADALLISSPEYVAGVPGAMKNALDWLAGGTEISDKAVGSINAAPYASLAQASLKKTLELISGNLVEAAWVTLPAIGKRLDDEALAAHPEVAPVIRAALEALRDAVSC